MTRHSADYFWVLQGGVKNFAGVEGVEPSVTVLETVGLPLTDTPLD